MRTTTALAASLALLSPLFAQRTLDADAGPIVRTRAATQPPAAQRVAPVDGRLGEQQAMPPFITEIHTQQDDPEGGAYGIWAAGVDYKVSFHDGATFVPYLGGDYPRNQPFRWSTTSVTVGNEELVTRQEPIANQASGTRYEYDHGGVVEAYDVLLDGLEQTFVIANAPAAGDLVVRGTVDTLLTAAPAASQHGGVRFVDHNGDPILTYGAATAIDASGRTSPMTTTFKGGEFELELDSAWLANATYPVTVDPLLQNRVVFGAIFGQFGDPDHYDVLRDDDRATENVWICYTRQVSANDQDMWLMRTEDNLPGTLFLQAFTDLSSSWGHESCALAYVNGRVICAFTRNFGANRSVRWHTHHTDDLAVRTGYGSFTASTNDWRVDIGGNRAWTPSQRAMVVFQHEAGGAFANGPNSESRAFYIDVSGVTTQTGQGTAVNPVTLLGSPSIDSERPRINRVADGAASGNHWCVVHQYVSSSVSNDDWDVYVDFWNETGTLAAYGTIEPDNGEHKLGPVVAGSAGRYLVSYAGVSTGVVPSTTFKTGYELNTQRVDYDGASLTFPHPPHQYISSPVRRLETNDLAFDTNTRSHWLVIARDNETLWADMMGFRGHSTIRQGLYFGSSSGIENPGTCSFDDDHDTFVIVHSLTGGNHPLFGNIWSNPANPAPSVGGFGCSPANLSWGVSGLPSSQRIGHEYSGITLSGLAPGSLATVGLSLYGVDWGFNNASSSVGTGCRLLIGTNAGFLGFLPFGIGSAAGTVTWPLPLLEGLPLLTLHMQAAHFDASTSLIMTTQRLSVPISY